MKLLYTDTQCTDYHYVAPMSLSNKKDQNEYVAPINISITALNTLDYSMYNQILSEYVIDGKVKYIKLRKSMMREQQKDSLFIKWLNIISKIGPNTEPTLFSDENEKLKFYMNAYNALTIYGVLYHSFYYKQHRLITSVKDIKSRLNIFDGFGFFESAMYELDNDNTMTLNRLENDIIRKQFNDVRVHCAINCASNGCPKLQSSVIEVGHLDKLCNEFVNDEQYVQIDKVNHKIKLSQIFKWYQEDFVQFYDNECNQELNMRKFEKHKFLYFVWKYGDDEVREDLNVTIANDYDIEWPPYDWELNKYITDQRKSAVGKVN